MNEVNEGIASNIFCETCTTVAEDAALTVEQYKVADRNRLFLVTLLFNKAALAGPVGHGLILKRTFATLVTDGTVERMIREEELEDSVLSFLCDFRFSIGLHARGALDHATGLKRWPAACVDFDQTHATHTNWLHALVVTKARNEGAGAFGGIDEQLALMGNDLNAVDFDGDAVDGGHLELSHARTPS